MKREEAALRSPAQPRDAASAQKVRTSPTDPSSRDCQSGRRNAQHFRALARRGCRLSLAAARRLRGKDLACSGPAKISSLSSGASSMPRITTSSSGTARATPGMACPLGAGTLRAPRAAARREVELWRTMLERPVPGRREEPEHKV